MKIEYKIVGIYRSKSKYSILYCIGVDRPHTDGFKSEKLFVPTENLDNYKLNEYVVCHSKKYGDKYYTFAPKNSTPSPIYMTVSPDELPF